jgi:peptide/nickel transport system substrate-binding protein
MTIRKTFLLALFSLAAACWLTAAWAQDKKRPKEEEDDTPKKPAATKTDDAKKTAEPAKDTPKKNEEEEEARPRKSAVPGLGAPVSLADAAKQAPHPKIKEALEKLVLQVDTVTTVNGTTWEVEPLKKRFEPNQQGPVDFKRVKDGTELRKQREELSNVTHYELRLAEVARQLQNSGLDKPDASGKVAVPHSKLLHYAEILLSEAVRFHVDARNKKLRVDGWTGLEAEFRKELQQVQFAQLRALTGDGDWEGGEALAHHLRFGLNYAPTRDLMDAIESHFVAQANALIAKDDHPAARRKLEFYATKYASGAVSAQVEQVHKVLREKAAQYLREGEALGTKGETSKAFALVQKAEETWPTLAGIREARARYLKANPVLRVGVKQLPTQVSPTTAVTDVDHAACELVFDRLFNLRAGPSARDGYECKLGIDIQPTTSGGLQLVLPADIKWSDGKPFTTDDLLRSKEILVDKRCPYYDPEAAALLTRFQSEDDYHLSIEFTRGSIDPASFLTFPILPAHRLARERSPVDPAFGKSPIGTGPYVFKGIEGNEAIFQANPHYKRAHAPDGPAIKEIRFVHYPDFQQAKQALVTGVVQILYGLTTDEFEQLQGAGPIDLLTPTQPHENTPGAFTNPRIYFLAPNLRKPALANADLRKAISMSINRDAILDSVFRGKDKKGHVVLNGPFPVQSWAYDQEQYGPGAGSPFKPQAAKGHMTQAQSKLGQIPALSLHYPADDPLAAKACAEIQKMLAVNGIAVEPKAQPRDAIIRDLAKARPDFDLVYWHHDFETETLSLWPLFDPNGADGNGRNYIGMVQDTEVPGRFTNLQTRRDLPVVKRTAHELHGIITNDKALLIPLWQLDRYVAVHKTNVRTTRVHPLWLFDDVEEWRLTIGN